MIFAAYCDQGVQQFTNQTLRVNIIFLLMLPKVLGLKLITSLNCHWNIKGMSNNDVTIVLN